MRSGGSGSNTFLEAFKTGTAPPDSYSVIGGGGSGGGRAYDGAPQAGGTVTTGTGSLY